LASFLSRKQIEKLETEEKLEQICKMINNYFLTVSQPHYPVSQANNDKDEVEKKSPNGKSDGEKPKGIY